MKGIAYCLPDHCNKQVKKNGGIITVERGKIATGINSGMISAKFLCYAGIVKPNTVNNQYKKVFKFLDTTNLSLDVCCN